MSMYACNVLIKQQLSKNKPAAYGMNMGSDHIALTQVVSRELNLFLAFFFCLHIPHHRHSTQSNDSIIANSP